MLEANLPPSRCSGSCAVDARGGIMRVTEALPCHGAFYFGSVVTRRQSTVCPQLLSTNSFFRDLRKMTKTNTAIVIYIVEGHHHLSFEYFHHVFDCPNIILSATESGQPSPQPSLFRGTYAAAEAIRATTAKKPSLCLPVLSTSSRRPLPEPTHFLFLRPPPRLLDVS